MKATLLDMLRGTTKIVSGYGSIFWAEGDFAHDCCRRLVSDDGDDEAGGRFRFLVMGAEFDPGEPEFTLHQLNALYPHWLLETHGVELDQCPGSGCWEDKPPKRSWRELDARDLIPPAEAQKLLRLWEVTGFNFIWRQVLSIIEEVENAAFASPEGLREMVKDLAEARLLQGVNALHAEWKAAEKEVAQ